MHSGYIRVHICNFPRGGSGCHAMFASPDAALYRFLGGIEIDRTKNTPVTIKPYCPPELSFVTCAVKTPEGEIRVHWRREKGGILFEIAVPRGLPAFLLLGEGASAHTETLPDGGRRRIFYSNTNQR